MKWRAVSSGIILFVPKLPPTKVPSIMLASKVVDQTEFPQVISTRTETQEATIKIGIGRKSEGIVGKIARFISPASSFEIFSQRAVGQRLDDVPVEEADAVNAPLIYVLAEVALMGMASCDLTPKSKESHRRASARDSLVYL
jgi:hypothetical protein